MKLKSFSQYMDLISYRYGAGQVFSDFLEMTICALSMGAAENRYFEIIKRYDKPELEQFSLAFAALVNEMTGDGSGLIDVLGEYFMINISFGKNGQFFTPQPICDMMSGMVKSYGPGYRVCDPACGSGRMLLAAAKFNHAIQMYGADNDLTCVNMATINLCLNGLFGEVAWMDTLSNQWYRSYRIELHEKGVPYIRQITEDESYIVLKLPEPVVQKKETPLQQLVFHF